MKKEAGKNPLLCVLFSFVSRSLVLQSSAMCALCHRDELKTITESRRHLDECIKARSGVFAFETGNGRLCKICGCGQISLCHTLGFSQSYERINDVFASFRQSRHPLPLRLFRKGIRGLYRFHHHSKPLHRNRYRRNRKEIYP